MTATASPRSLLTQRQVAAQLGVSVPTVRRLTKSGVLPAVRLGKRSVRYRPETLDALREETP
jgi:excisionase family DNA binding protein